MDLSEAVRFQSFEPAAGGVEGLLRGAAGEPGAHDGILVAVAGGRVDREAEDPLLQPFTPWW